MDQHIRYVQTSDGVSIAYSVAGAGPVVVFVSSLFGDAVGGTREPTSGERSLLWPTTTPAGSR
jgi:hypothetical protein